MPYSNASYGGEEIFGLVREFVHNANPCATQVDSFFGVPGSISLFGGSRGRTFMVSGVLIADDIEGLNFAEGLIHSFADGIGRTIVSTRGQSWDNVVFKDEFQPDPGGPHPFDEGWCLPYRCVFHGLT